MSCFQENAAIDMNQPVSHASAGCAALLQFMSGDCVRPCAYEDGVSSLQLLDVALAIPLIVRTTHSRRRSWRRRCQDR